MNVEPGGEEVATCSDDLNDDTNRYVGLVAKCYQRHTSHDGDILQLPPVDKVDVSRPQYPQTVSDGREEQHATESTVDSEEIPGPSVEEELRVDGNCQDSDNDDYFTPPSSLNSHHSEVFNKEGSVHVLNGIETEVEEKQKVENKFDVDDDEMVEEKDCEEESQDQEVAHNTNGSSAEITPEIVQGAVEPPSKQTEQEACNTKILYISDVFNWLLNDVYLCKMVSIGCGLLHIVRHPNGGHVTLVCIKVARVDREVFIKWERLDGIPQCDIVVAYLEDGKFGYIVKEYFKNGLREVIVKICASYLKMIENKADVTKVEMEEMGRLYQLLKRLLISFIDAVEYFHNSDCILMNCHVNNLYVRFNCDCWARPICVHGSSGATVIIGNCESAYPVGSLIDNPNSSKALKLLGPMDKYKKAEVVYGYVDLVFVIIGLFSKIIGGRDCERKMNAWSHNIADGVFTDPPVEAVQQLLEECGISPNHTNRIIGYLKVSAAHYSRACGEHEV